MLESVTMAELDARGLCTDRKRFRLHSLTQQTCATNMKANTRAAASHMLCVSYYLSWHNIWFIISTGPMMHVFDSKTQNIRMSAHKNEGAKKYFATTETL